MRQPARAQLSALLKRVAGVDQGPVSQPGDLTSARPGDLHDVTGHTFARPHARPRLTSLELDTAVAGAGAPVTVTWAFESARSVTVDGSPGYPPSGTTTVSLLRTRHVQIVAHNELGTTTARTKVVTVLPVAQIHEVSVPRPMGIHLHADVRATVAAGETVRDRLQRTLDTQDRFRPVLHEKLHPIGVPTHFVRWLASAPRVSFFRDAE